MRNCGSTKIVPQRKQAAVANNSPKSILQSILVNQFSVKNNIRPLGGSHLLIKIALFSIFFILPSQGPLRALSSVQYESAKQILKIIKKIIDFS